MLEFNACYLWDDQYLIHIANRVYQEIKDKSAELPRQPEHRAWFCRIQNRGLAQNGHNGTDYLLVVPDKELAGMKKYFSLMASYGKWRCAGEFVRNAYKDLAGKSTGIMMNWLIT